MAMVVATSGFVTCGLTLLIPAVIYLVLKGFERAAQAKMHRFRATTDCGGVAPGPVELKGRVSSKETVETVLGGEPAVYYKTEIKEGARGDWQTTVDEEKMTLFYVEDESGRVRVDPRGAEFHVSEAILENVSAGRDRFKLGPKPRHGVEKRQFMERVLAVGDEVYVLGHARENRDLAVPEIRAQKDEPFVISDHDESHLIERHMRAATLYFVNAYFLALPIPATLTAVFQGMPFAEALAASVLPTFGLVIGLPVLLWGIYRLNHYRYLEKLGTQIKEGRRILRQECQHREELVEKLIDEVSARAEVWTVRARLDDLREERARNAVAIARMKSNEELGRVVDRQTKALDRTFAAVEAAGLVEELASESSMVSLFEELTRSEHRLVMGKNFINDGLERLWNFAESNKGPGARNKLEFSAFERKPIEVILEEDPESLYSGKVDAEERGVDLEEQQDRREEESPPAGEEREENWNVDEVKIDGGDEEVRESSVGGEAEEDEWESRWPDLEPISVSMRFEGDSESAFGDIGRFGQARDFSSLTRADGKEERAKREAFGFSEDEKKWGSKGASERAQKSGDKSQEFGFSDEEKRGVLAAFED